MESIRINISKQLSGDGLVPVIAYPSEAAYDFRVHNFAADMDRLSTLKAYEARVYPGGRNMQLSLIRDIQGGFIQYAILVDTGKLTVTPHVMAESLRQMAASYEAIAADDPKPSGNHLFQKAIADIYRQLTQATKAGLPDPLPTPGETKGTRPTYYMKYKTEAEVETLLSYPNQDFFRETPSIYLIPPSVQPASPRECKQVHSIVLRTFKILGTDGHEYGEVKEGDTKRVSLRGKEGMLPMTTDVVGDISAPTPYGYFDSSANAIRIDERGVRFYYELKFLVKANGRTLRSCTVRHNGEQVMPDSNGCYVMKIYEADLHDAGTIHFSGDGFKDTDIQVTPGIVKQQEYIFTPEPQHDMARVTLDFGDGNPLHTHFDLGDNERLYHQLEGGRVKGYKVSKEGEEYVMKVPRRLTQSSKNTLRLLKALFMMALTLALYAGVTYAMTRHWPWPIESVRVVVKEVSTKTTFDKTGEIATQTEVDADDEPMIEGDDTDQVKLEAIDREYLESHDVWRRDSIRSNKYQDIVNTIFNGSIQEIRMKNYDTRVIANPYWAQVWKQVMLPNAVHKDKVKLAFTQSMSTDRNALDLQRLWETLSAHLRPSDGPISKPATGYYGTPKSTTGY